MYIDKYWGNYIGDTDDSLNLVAFLADQKKDEIPLGEIFAKIGLDQQNWDFRQTVGHLEYTHSSGVDLDFHFAIDLVADLAAILLECRASGSVDLHDLDRYNTPSRRIRITATPSEHEAMNKALADFAQNPLSYDLRELVDQEDMWAMARLCQQLRRELYEATPNPAAAELLEQCRKWNEDEEYQKIVDALESVPAGERTPEMDSDLARAYNNLGARSGNRELLKKAIALLEPHQEYFQGDHCWNFRMGYSWYYLDQEGRALPYFRKALEARPGDEDTQELIDDCQKCIALPRFQENFRERTEKAWQAFSQQESHLRRIMDADKNHERGQELLEQCEAILGLAFADISFEMGYNGQKYELILTPEGNKVKLFELVYFQKHVPEKVLEHWNILVGRQPNQRMGLRTDDGWDISGDDVQIWLESQGENRFAISAYCEKLLPLLREEEGRAWWMLTTLTDQVLGEIPHMRYIESFDVLESPKGELSILLSRLPEKLQERGVELSTDPEDYLERYLGYEMQPNEDPEADWRLDVIAGSTCCPPLINDYLHHDNDSMDDLHADGVVAGFFCYPLDGFSGEDRSRQIFDFRDKLEETLSRSCGPDVLTITGGATGIYCGYVDFIAWDLLPALNAAREFFAETDILWADFHVFRREARGVGLKKPAEDESEAQNPEEEPNQPEVYTEAEMETIEEHIQQYFGKFESVFHELVSPDIHVDVCLVPPSEERDYYTLVTMGMGAHRMNVPAELAEYKLERAELAISLPSDWNMKQEDFQDERWYWPVRLLKGLARFPGECDTWLGWGHTVDNREPFAGNTQLCASLLVGPQNAADGSKCCVLPNGEEVNFYQVIPLYRDELTYKLEHNADALLEKMAGISFVVDPDRQDAITRGTICSGDDADNYVTELDDAAWHLESIREKHLPVDEITAYNHMAIYLRWCMEHDLMDQEFLTEYGEVVNRVKTDPGSVDLRTFIRDALEGQLSGSFFSKKGRAFATYYYGENDSPYYPGDIDDYAFRFFGPDRYYSHEFQDEAYLFIPFDEKYHQAMAEVVDQRFANWQGQDFDEDTQEPSDLARAMMEYLDCACTYFPSMKDDDPIMSAYSYARRAGVREGFVPVLLKPDETLWECLIINSDPDSDGEDDYAFDPDRVAEYRRKMLAAPVKDGKAVLEARTGERKAEAADDELDWEEEVLGEMKGGYDNCRFSSYWNSETGMTYPLILAKIPVQNPWEIFAYLPFGGWNECPHTPELMAVAQYWFERYGAVPAAMSHDELEFDLPAPVVREQAMETALEQYGFCPDIVDQEPEDDTVGSLADVLWQSTVWYFWWD